MSFTPSAIWRFLKMPKLLQLRVMRILNDEFLVGVTGIFLTKDGKVLLVKHSYRQKAWSLPGGYLKAKEHPTEGLEREVKEETKLTVSADTLLKVRTDRETGRLDMCYIGAYIGGEFEPSDEVVEAGTFSFDELPDIFSDQVLLIKEALTYQNSRRPLHVSE